MSQADDELIRLIDQRIRLARSQDKAAGTVVTRDTTGPGAMVMFDGATVATPAKVLGTTFVRPGDRCLLDRYGTSDWIVTGSFAISTFGEAARHMSTGLAGTTAALTSASYIDFTDFTTLPFTKAHDLTMVRAQVVAGAFASVAGTKVSWALRYTPVSGAESYTPVDITMATFLFNTANEHNSVTGMGRVTTLPAGSYSVTLRWRRISGTGNVFADVADEYSVEIDERPRASVPIL